MPELPNRDDLEADFAKAFGRVARMHMHEFREALGDPPDLENVPEEFWVQMQKETEDDAWLIILLIWTASAEFHGWHGPDMRLTGYGYAVNRGREFSERWVESTRSRMQKEFDKLNKPPVESTVIDARETNRFLPTKPPAPTREEIDDILDDVFSPKRVVQWVEDETTRARHWGGESAIEETVGLSPEDLWINDEHSNVCPICKPLNETPRSYWGRFFPDGPPSPHSRCMCWVLYANVEGPALVGAKSYSPNEPRDSHGRWTDSGSSSEIPESTRQFLNNNPVVNAMRRLEHGANNGALVPIRELRKEAGLDESTFESLMAALSQMGVISLHTHDHPSSLTDKERGELLVLPGDGRMSWRGNNYFVGAAIRQNGPHKKSLELREGSLC